MRKTIMTDRAPAAIGPYAQGNMLCDDAQKQGLIFTSGQLGLVPESGELAAGGVEAQARQSLENLKAVLEEAGSSMDKVIKTTCFLKDMGDFAKVNAVYAGFFQQPYPSRSAIEVARLPKDALIEIEAVAYL